MHYLVTKLLTEKGLRAPKAGRVSLTGPAEASRSVMFNERECYDCLIEVEHVLAAAISGPPAPRRGRRKTQAAANPSTTAVVLKNAGDVLDFGCGRGWILERSA